MLRAAACCLHLLQHLNNFSPAEGVTLTLHMGVGVGEMSAFYVGGNSHKWEYFVAGEPIEQMSDAAEEASSGELVISQAAIECLHYDDDKTFELKGQRLESGRYLLEDIVTSASGFSAVDLLVSPRSLRDGLNEALAIKPQTLEPVLRCFVPQLVEERLDAGQHGLLVHEHRKLVSVFMKVQMYGGMASGMLPRESESESE